MLYIRLINSSNPLDHDAYLIKRRGKPDLKKIVGVKTLEEEVDGFFIDGIIIHTRDMMAEFTKFSGNPDIIETTDFITVRREDKKRFLCFRKSEIIRMEFVMEGANDYQEEDVFGDITKISNKQPPHQQQQSLKKGRGKIGDR